MSIIKVGISGVHGKMGSAVESAINSNNSHFKLIGRLNSASKKSDIKNFCQECDVIIDFSNPEVIKDIMYFASIFLTNIVIGTTGLKDEQLRYMKLVAKDIAIVHAPNTSLGACILEDLSKRVASVLENYDVEIIESHHKYKKDSPSGTAIQLGKAIAKTKNIDFKTHAVFNRYNNGLRKNNDITFSSIRGGGIIAEHKIIFAGDHETICIEHKALTRDIFVQGALSAASWIIGKKPGIYSMGDII